MRVGSIFSGIGGIELGLERAGGFETAWFVENDPHAQAVLRKHWPGTPIYDDVTTVDFANVPRIDILTGGFPCQDISNAGKRAGITGRRSSLWSYCVEAMRVLRPRVAVFENVAALIGWFDKEREPAPSPEDVRAGRREVGVEQHQALETVLLDLREIGYDAEWHCFPAAAVGAPHRRDRIVILAYPDRERQLHGQSGEQSDCRGGETQHDAWESGEDVADAECERQRGRGSLEQPRHPFNGSETSGRSGDSRGWWAVEPDVGRVVDGVPARLDRIKRLGNAVVPQWAEAIASAVKEVEGW